MLILALGSVLAALTAKLIFLPLFLFTWLLVSYRQALFLALLIFGLGFDLFWVYPLGTGILLYSVFVLVVYLYSQNYSYYHQGFLLIFLLIYSFLLLKFTQQSVTSQGGFVFTVMFLYLSFLLKKSREEHFVSL